MHDGNVQQIFKIVTKTNRTESDIELPEYLIENYLNI